MQHKSKKIFSELSTFFRNNDNSDAIFSVRRVMDGLRFGATDMGSEKCCNCKLTALQTLSPSPNASGNSSSTLPTNLFTEPSRHETSR